MVMTSGDYEHNMPIAISHCAKARGVSICQHKATSRPTAANQRFPFPQEVNA